MKLSSPNDSGSEARLYMLDSCLLAPSIRQRALSRIVYQAERGVNNHWSDHHYFYCASVKILNLRGAFPVIWVEREGFSRNQHHMTQTVV